jgi:hypothetical protein
VFTGKLSGLASTARPGLTAMLDYARAGVTVVAVVGHDGCLRLL